jgi:hypothetical protein
MKKGEVVEILPKITKKYYTIVYAIGQKDLTDMDAKKILINKFLLDHFLINDKRPFMKYNFSYKQCWHANVKINNINNELTTLLDITYYVFNAQTFNHEHYQSKVKYYKSILEDNIKTNSPVFPPTGNIDVTTPQTAVSTPDNRRIMSYNVMHMLKLLFPTSLPTKYNILSSYENYIMQQTESGFSSIKELVFSNNKYSYLSMNGKKYTVTKVIWLNDVYNNPIYKKCIDNYLFMNGKIEDEKEKVQNYINDKYEDLIKFTKADEYAWKDQYIDRIIFNNVVYIPINGKNYKNATNRNHLIKSFASNDDSQTYFVNTINHDDGFPIQTELEKAYIGIQSEFDQSFPKQKESFDKKYILLKTMFTVFIIQSNHKSNVENITTILELYNDIKKIEDALSTLNKISQEQRKQYKKIISFIREIYLYSTIRDTYLSDSININLKDEEEEVLNKLKSDFKVIVDFIEGIKEILPRGGKTTTNEDLQTNIVNYSKGDSYKDETCSFEKLLKYVSKNFTRIHPIEDDATDYCDDIKNKDAKFYNTELMKINANEYNKPQYEIHISTDLIEGEVNDENIRTAACMYKDMYLGRELEYMTKPHNIYDILEDGIFFKFDGVAMTGPKSKSKQSTEILEEKKQSTEKTEEKKQSTEKTEEKKDVKKQLGGNRKKTHNLYTLRSDKFIYGFDRVSAKTVKLATRSNLKRSSKLSTLRYYKKMKPNSRRAMKRVKRTLKKKR